MRTCRCHTELNMTDAHIAATQTKATVTVRCFTCGRQYTATIDIHELEPEPTPEDE